MKNIYSLNPGPPSCTYNSFRGVDVDVCTLYVPIGSYSAYLSVDVWEEFFRIIEMVGVETLDAEDVTETVATLKGIITTGDHSLDVTSQGFEFWKEGTEGVVTTILSEGNDMSYSITNLESETTYVYHAFVTTEDGTIYGDDVEFTTEKVFLSPTVLTYEATDITSTSALIKGYVEAGTEDITEQGFEYWTGNEEPESIVSEDNVMALILSGLNPKTTYTYHAYAITDSGTTYGEDVEFITLEDTTTGINGISIDSENIEGIYSTSGQKLNSTVKGVNIIRYNDGSVKKIYVK